MKATLEATAIEYLTEIKFRNAVKRTLGSIIGKNSYSRYGISVSSIKSVSGNWFTVSLINGVSPEKMNSDALRSWIKRREEMIFNLIAAGFETTTLEITTRSFGKEYTNDVRVWRKAAK